MREQTSTERPEAKIEGDSDQQMLLELMKESFDYFIDQYNDDNGLVADKTQEGSPCSIAVVGLAISCYLVGVDRGFMTRQDAIDKILKTLNFFYNSTQSEAPDATGYKGFYYHFLDMKTGKRVWDSELSTIDTALFIAGVLSANCYFNGNNEQEKQIRTLADSLYKRVDWKWATNNGATLSHGWKPSTGFLKYNWTGGYSEALILYILAMGSPTHPIGVEGYEEWQSTFEWKALYGIPHIFAGPLFIHQLSHLWIDFRGIKDVYNKKVGIDYFENSRRATLVQQQYAIDNPNKFEKYGEHCWGLSANDGPGPAIRTVNGRKIKFYNYSSRGVDGLDDGTISPWAIVTSLPFAPDIVIDTIRSIIETLKLLRRKEKGLHAGFNATFPEKSENANGWVSPWQFGLNQGPVVLMIENYFTGSVWKHMCSNPYLVAGLRKAGFTSGWLDDVK